MAIKYDKYIETGTEVVSEEFKHYGHAELNMFHGDEQATSTPEQGSIFSFFSGAGFLDLGFELTGFQIAFVNEIYPSFMHAYKESRKPLNIASPKFGYSLDSVEIFQDIKKDYLAKSVEQQKKLGLVGFIGGPPCPDFSVAGKNKGRTGDNGKLTGVYFDLIKNHKPDWFLFENVKGLWSTKRHKEYYDEILKDMIANGYSITDRLINALEFGAPQDRQRVIMIGFSESLCKKLNIAQRSKLSEQTFPWESYMPYPKDKAFQFPWPEQNEFHEKITEPQNIPKELTVKYWFDKNQVNHHANGSCQFTPRSGSAKFATVSEGDVSRKSYKRLHRWRYSPTVCYGNNEVHLHPTLARRISVAEALSLQSLPSNFSLPLDMTLSAMFKTVGNGVPFLAGQGIAKTIKDFII